MQYRRARTPGGTYFFTVVTHGRRRFLCEPENVALAINPCLPPHAWRKKEQAVWQRRFWEHKIRDEEDFRSTWNISITTRSNTVWLRRHATGRTPRFTGMW